MTRPLPQSALRFPLSSIFSTEVNLRVLRELSRHGGQLSATDLMMRARVTHPSVIKALTTLTEFSIVAEAGSRRSRVYRLEPESPFHAALVHLFNAEEARFDESIQAVRECAQSFGTDVIAAWIYGSVARGEDKAHSDLDIMFISAEDAVNSVQHRAVDILLEHALRLKFSPSVSVLSLVDLKRLADGNDPLWNDLVNQALGVIGPRPDVILKAAEKSTNDQSRFQ